MVWAVVRESATEMIAKARKPTETAPTPAPTASRRPRRGEPLEVRLSLKVRFGDAPDESVVLMKDRQVPMVDSVFQNRDRILRGFTMLLLKASLAQPKVVREVFPALKLMGRLRNKS